MLNDTNNTNNTNTYYFNKITYYTILPIILVIVFLDS